jgi:queuine tRNA-ribosyltransferase
MQTIEFNLEHTDSSTRARTGTLHTAHGAIPTPMFMPVGTQASVKAVRQESLRDEVGARIILGNTYHLYLRPGCSILESAGGLHAFMGWNRPILTDSGGYQVFSLADRRKIREEGVTFASHIDGSRHVFSPESVVDAQRSIGADICMAFDECPPYPCEESYLVQSMHRTHRWLDRCLVRWDETEPLYGYPQALFPIVQGGTLARLREESARYIVDRRPCEGYAIGGLSVGEPAEMMYEMCGRVCEILPSYKPRYLMGVGTPANLLENIALGVDLFDCVMPTRNARNGMLFTWNGIINLKNARWRSNFDCLDAESSLPSDRNYSLAYLAHLFQTGEMLGPQLASLHNLHFYIDLVARARTHIMDGSFALWKRDTLPLLERRL